MTAAVESLPPALDESVRQRWSTPQWFVDECADRYAAGGFDLDVAAENGNAKADAWFGREVDGLKQIWTGRVWCNPPYVGIAPWVDRAIAAVLADEVDVVVMLLPGRVDQRWYHDLLRHAELVLPVLGRVQFVPPPGIAASSNREGSIVAVLRPPLRARP